MARVRRKWLERIPDYRWERRKGSGEGDEGPAPDEAGDPAAGIPEDGDDAPLDDDATQDNESTPGEDEQAARGEGQPSTREERAEPGEDGDPSADAAPPLNTELSIPDEIEAARREGEDERTPWNRHAAPRAFPLEGRYLRGLATRFARMVAKLAEDNADVPQEGDDEWDMTELVRRRFTGRLPNQCRMTREKRKVVVVLDTSPSCAHQARLFGSVAQVAEELGDCELYDAPNFALHSRWQLGSWEQLTAEERGWDFHNRVVLAFGDFDGIEHICQASRRRGNRIYWFSCEERPQVLERNREFFVKNFKGHYHAANDLHRLMRVMARVR